jgi:hypothetical protein
MQKSFFRLRSRDRSRKMFLPSTLLIFFFDVCAFICVLMLVSWSRSAVVQPQAEVARAFAFDAFPQI